MFFLRLLSSPLATTHDEEMILSDALFVGDCICCESNS